jgi:DNA-binding response OmpR family regulator
VTERHGKTGGRRVLVVDDDPQVVDRVVQLLSDDHEVLATTDWGEINQVFFRDGVDLVLMDVQLPVLGGDRLASVLSAAAGAKRTPIVFFSSADEDTMRRLVAETGADGYLSKSLKSAQLLAAVERYLRPL